MPMSSEHYSSGLQFKAWNHGLSTTYSNQICWVYTNTTGSYHGKVYARLPDYDTGGCYHTDWVVWKKAEILLIATFLALTRSVDDKRQRQ